jgi:hypothetical protein
MNFKSIIVAGLSVAALAISLPAHADTATVIDSSQSAVITGDRNTSNQTNRSAVGNSQSGRRSLGDTGTSVTNTQAIDVLGDRNRTNQNNGTAVINQQRRTNR